MLPWHWEPMPEEVMSAYSGCWGSHDACDQQFWHIGVGPAYTSATGLCILQQFWHMTRCVAWCSKYATLACCGLLPTALFFFFLAPYSLFSAFGGFFPVAYGFSCVPCSFYMLKCLCFPPFGFGLYFMAFALFWRLFLASYTALVCLLLSLTFSCSLWLFLALCDFPCSLWLFLAAVALLLPFFVIAIYQQMWFKGSLMFIHVSNMGWPPNFFAWDGCLFALAKKKKKHNFT